MGVITIGREDRRRAARLVRKAGLKPGLLIITGTGKINRVTERNEKWIIVKTKKDGPPIKFRMETLEMAAAYMYRFRIAERKEMGLFHEFTSCLFGILRSIFKNLARVDRRNRFLRLVLKGIRFYLAGGDKCVRDLKVAVKAGARYVLMSYYYLRNKSEKWKDRLKENNLRLLLDSGAFTLHQARRKGKKVKDITIEDYARFIKKHRDIIDGVIVLDVVGDYLATKENLRKMESMGIPVIPVFHLGAPWEELKNLVECGRYPVIALGGTVGRSKRERREFLDAVFGMFPDQPFHGLGICDITLLLAYPFFSCDSSSWMLGRKKNVRLTLKGQVKGDYKTPLKERLRTMAQNVKFLVGLEAVERYNDLQWPKYTQIKLAL